MSAIDTYAAALAAHRRDWDAEHGTWACTCGWRYTQPSRRSGSRALSLHITAAHKRADRAFDAAVEQELRRR